MGKNSSHLYDLQGIVCHIGSLDQGHYVAYIRGYNDDNDTWYKCDDDNVVEVDQSTVEAAEG
jgi:ubiquitin carboxyl-terminal hydrolase 22/27/51